MNNRLVLLAGLGLAQIVLILVVWALGASGSAPVEKLLAFEPASVSAVSIGDGSSNVRLNRGAEGWQVGELPADASKIDAMLEKLAGVETPWPVATTAGSADRFEVAEDKYQRHVALFAGEEPVAELYLGTSPGYQRVHARRAGDDHVFSIELSNYEVPADADGWLDKSLFATADTPQQVKVRFLGESPREALLERGDEGWLFNGQAAAQDAAATYANRFNTLRVLGPAAATQDEVNHLAVIELKTGDGGGEGARQLDLYRVGEDGDYLLGGAGREQRFRVATYIAEQLLMTDVDLSVAAAQDAGEPTSES